MKQNQTQDVLQQVYANQFKPSVQSSVDEQRLHSTNNNVGEMSIASKVFVAVLAALAGVVIITMYAIVMG